MPKAKWKCIALARVFNQQNGLKQQRNGPNYQDAQRQAVIWPEWRLSVHILIGLGLCLLFFGFARTLVVVGVAVGGIALLFAYNNAQDPEPKRLVPIYRGLSDYPFTPAPPLPPLFAPRTQARFALDGNPLAYQVRDVAVHRALRYFEFFRQRGRRRRSRRSAQDLYDLEQSVGAAHRG